MSDATYTPDGAAPGAAAAGHDTDHAHSHATPVKLLLGVFAALVVLTGITVLFANVAFKEQFRLFMNEQFYPMRTEEVSRLSLWVAMLIATIKGSLVVLYFMHLRWDKPFNAIAFVASLLFVALFIGFSMTDSVNYHTEAERQSMLSDRQAEGVGRQPGELIHHDHGDEGGDAHE